MTLTLPIPPTANHLHTVARGRKIKSQAARDYATTVSWAVTEWRLANPTAWTPSTSERLRSVITVYPPDRRRFDIENRVKALHDSVFACLEADDAQVDELRVLRREPDKANPRVVITLRPA
jgi:crossover junction endodeoxyribonuclease RusA